MTTLKNRLDRLEEQLRQQTPQLWHHYFLEDGQTEPTAKQQAEIDAAVAQGKNTICFRVVD